MEIDFTIAPRDDIVFSQQDKRCLMSMYSALSVGAGLKCFKKKRGKNGDEKYFADIIKERRGRWLDESLCGFHGILPDQKLKEGNPAVSSQEIRGFPTPPRDGCGVINFPFPTGK